jgi:lipopolysaccharide export system protein LptA
MRKVVPMALAALWIWTAAALAQTPAPAPASTPAPGPAVAPPGPFQGFKSTGKDPIELTANRLEADLGSNKIAFIGRVSAKQGERTIYAERMDIVYTPGGEITTLLAVGNVKVRQKDSFATCDRLSLDNKAKVIKLIGNPKVVQGNQIVTGSEMTYQIDKERILVPNPRIDWKPEEGVPKTVPVPKGPKK